MSAQVELAFRRFDAHIRLSADQVHAAQDAERQVVRIVSGIDNVTACLPVGSMVRGTAVRKYSDLDLLAVFSEQRSSDSFIQPAGLLAELAELLRRNANFTHVEVGAVAISLRTKCWPTVDVIPALFVNGSLHDGQAFRIPADNSQLWQLYSPQSQNALVANRERELGPRLKSLIRMVKWWNHTNASVLASFGVEWLVCTAFEYAIPAYPKAVCSIFEAVSRQSDHDDLFVAGRDRVTRALDVALVSSHAALRADVSGTTSGARRAVEHWRELFGDEFPDIA
jgi:predicted nucleotidyltransferase